MASGPFTDLRARLAWSQAQLAAWYGVSTLTLNRWENGAQEPPALHERVARLITSVADPTPLLRLLGPQG
jgi:DNA-binding transcriptional regulator YiaG